MREKRKSIGKSLAVRLFAGAICLICGICALCLVACSDGEKDFTVGLRAAYEDGGLVCRWSLEGARADSFAVYASEDKEGAYERVAEVKDGVYRAADPALYYRAAAVRDGEEIAFSAPFSFPKRTTRRRYRHTLTGCTRRRKERSFPPTVTPFSLRPGIIRT